MEYSPLLSVGTGVFEITAAIVIWKTFRGNRSILRTTSLILLFLGGYQLIEAFVCHNPANVLAARLAFADVVWLPPLGVLLVVQLSSPKKSWVRNAPYAFLAVGGFFSLWALFNPTFVTSTVCSAVFAQYTQGASSLYMYYGSFYQLGLMIMVFGVSIAMPHVESQVARQHLADLQMGTLAFMMFALLTMLLIPSTNLSMPSIMCHYALILSLFLVRLAYREHRLTEKERALALTCQTT